MLGWVEPNVGGLFGNCEGLPVSTPTQDGEVHLSGVERCRVSGIDANPLVDIYSYPSNDADIVRTMRQQTTSVMTGRLEDDSWYLVRYTEGSRSFAGWVFAQDVALFFNCNAVPVVDADYLESTATPVLQVSEPVPTPMITPATRPQITLFNTTPVEITAGSMVTVIWDTENASDLWLEYYNPENVPDDSDEFNPNGLYSDLPSSRAHSISSSLRITLLTR